MITLFLNGNLIRLKSLENHLHFTPILHFVLYPSAIFKLTKVPLTLQIVLENLLFVSQLLNTNGSITC